MILMYHNIDKTSYFNTVSLENLDSQLKFIKNNYTPVSVDKYIDFLKKNKSTKKSKIVAITINDGYKSFKKYFVPLLEKYQIPATLFIPVNHVNGFNSWDEDRIDIMNWDEIKELTQNPLITIASHGLDHKSIAKLTKENIKNEICLSKKILEEKLDLPITYFSFPFGQITDYNQYALEIVKKEKYKAAFSTRYNNRNHIKDIYNLFRIEVEPKDSLQVFKKKCQFHYHIKLIKRLIKEFLTKLK